MLPFENDSDLNQIGQDLNGIYALGKDIRLNSATDGGFVPIGDTTHQAFTQQFDGMGHRIDGPTTYLVDQSAAYGGVFYAIGPSGIVRNIGITNASFNVENGLFSGVLGLLVGYNAGLITYAYSSGAAFSDYGGDGAGGLVGLTDGTIERSSSTASVGASGYVDGLVSENNGLILQSYSTVIQAVTSPRPLADLSA